MPDLTGDCPNGVDVVRIDLVVFHLLDSFASCERFLTIIFAPDWDEQSNSRTGGFVVQGEAGGDGFEQGAGRLQLAVESLIENEHGESLGAKRSKKRNARRKALLINSKHTKSTSRATLACSAILASAG
jgi:hypothetical protein